MDGYSILRIVAALLLMIGLIAICGWLAKRGGLANRLGQQAGVRIVSRQSLGARSSIVILDVPGAQLVLGVTPSSINLLHKIDSDSQQGTAGSVQQEQHNDFRSLLGRVMAKPGTDTTQS